MFGGVIFFLLSLIGVLINAFLLFLFLSDPAFSGDFYKLCVSKTISNLVVLLTHLLWVAPCSILNSYYISSIDFNLFVSQIGAVSFYFLGGLTQICMASNRFLITAFPSKIGQQKRTRYSMTMLGISWILALLSIAACFLARIAIFYDLHTLGYQSSDKDHATTFFATQLITFLITSAISCSINACTTVNLLKTGVSGLATDASMKRRKRNFRLFIQNVFQDAIPLIDVINTFAMNFVTGSLFATFSSTFTLILVHVLDGLTMFIFSWPSWVARKTSVLRVTAASSTH
ncbi:unnamed protein product [Caenorhabditis auriculariae]|uniref:7TM GPCR serpentine receptor class x (Srx) domain-containing protein n=1 Tax=Caenorhabditis auriculariae TaxID=2777116 RepID=A0A8S1H0S6_9PELO|nr:unnamed protein product [Caenorhabditis auriculariae]